MAEVTSKVIPVIEEELVVEKRSVDTGGVRITKQVHAEEKIVDELLQHERVFVERHVVNQKVDMVPAIRREGNTLIIPLVEEVLVVEKQLILKEEVHLIIEQSKEQHSQTVTLRREEATIEHLPAVERKE